MKLSIPKLGRIRNLNVEIKPLTILIGNNGTGKTWTTYIYASLASQISREESSVNFEYSGKKSLIKCVSSHTDEIVEILKNVSSDQDIEMEFEKSHFYDSITSDISFSQDYKSLSKYTGMELDPDTRASLVFSKTETIGYRSKAKNIKVAIRRRHTLTFMEIYVGKHHISTLVLNRRLIESEELYNRVNNSLLSSIFRVYNAIVPFPAERKAIMLIYPLLLQALSMGSTSEEGTKSLSDSTRKFLSRPATLFKFINMLASAELGLANSDKDFQNISKHLENDVIKAQIFHKRNHEENGIIGVSIDGMPELELDSVHSLVRSLGGLDIYLKSIAGKNDLLLFDEPEMNAHPDAQVRIAEIMSMLVNSGINIVLTTHSSYFIDHISNLVHISEHKKTHRDSVIPSLKLKSEKAIILGKKVAAYLIDENGVVSDIFKDKREYIDWKNFGSVSDYLSDLANQIDTEA